MAQTQLEQNIYELPLEEQLRLMENGIPIRTVETRHQSLGVDRPEDVAIVSRWLTQTRKDKDT